jgi:hypothetical protein
MPRQDIHTAGSPDVVFEYMNFSATSLSLADCMRASSLVRAVSSSKEVLTQERAVEPNGERQESETRCWALERDMSIDSLAQNLTYNSENGAISGDCVREGFTIDCVPDFLHCRSSYSVVNDPWVFLLSNEPDICRNEGLAPSIIDVACGRKVIACPLLAASPSGDLSCIQTLLEFDDILSRVR